MSSESSDPNEKSRSLSLDIPTTYPASSVESSLNPSPTGILDSALPRSPADSESASTSSLPTPSLSVKFAPLPKLAPRKRRSAAPLGMAARSQLAGRRRRNTTDDDMMVYQGGNPMWTDEELDKQRILQVAETRRRRPREEGDVEEVDEVGDVEDPFLALGKIVKVASRTIWRKVSHKELSSKQKAKEARGKGDGEGEGKNSLPPTPASENPAPESLPPPVEIIEERHVLATITSNGEDVPGNKDAVEGELLLSVSQTETIVEGHTKYSWANDKTEDGAATTSNFRVL
ncbi:hypothetical protein Hypma_010622 [Hypsizygus marmoreus]|uniref:Uncharacterized protein n=1 Tax=Hypsizygus marmoreus TaxID=39966 RepID=A0A369JLS3_HYPMA|nr:hypothetical protein Hypma_010622 [Hypsizygus marmoreus]